MSLHMVKCKSHPQTTLECDQIIKELSSLENNLHCKKMKKANNGFSKGRNRNNDIFKL